MTGITFIQDAKDELISTAKYYNQQAFGLGIEFLNEIEKAIQIILKNPNTWTIIHDNIHKFNLHRFPFSIYYSYEKELDKIAILAIAHQKRKPGYWKTRI